MPAVGGRTMFVPQPYLTVQYLDDQFSFRCASQRLAAPIRLRLLLSAMR
jgi:hypothetical protein